MPSCFGTRIRRWGARPRSPSGASPRRLPGCTARQGISQPAPGPPTGCDPGAGNLGSNAERTSRGQAGLQGPFRRGHLRRQAPGEPTQAAAGGEGLQLLGAQLVFPRKCNNIYDLAMRKFSPSTRSISSHSPPRSPAASYPSSPSSPSPPALLLGPN